MKHEMKWRLTFRQTHTEFDHQLDITVRSQLDHNGKEAEIEIKHFSDGNG